jgi:hypothetical protein
MTQAYCNAGDQVLTDALAGTSTSTGFGVIYGTGSQTDRQLIEGCRLTLTQANGQSLDPTPEFLWRFGTLLAADAAAQKLLPAAPRASQAELDAVPQQ